MEIEHVSVYELSYDEILEIFYRKNNKQTEIEIMRDAKPKFFNLKSIDELD